VARAKIAQDSNRKQSSERRAAKRETLIRKADKIRADGGIYKKKKVDPKPCPECRNDFFAHKDFFYSGKRKQLRKGCIPCVNDISAANFAKKRKG